jgi:glucokinase
LKSEDLIPLNEIEPDITGPKGVIGAGTGFGEEYLTYVP